MSKFDEHIEKCLKSAEAIDLKIDRDLLIKVAKSLGPSIYNKDSSLVACSDPKELQRIKENFLIGKLGLKDDGRLDGVLRRVCEELGGTKSKWRAIFYTVIVQKVNAQNQFTNT